MRLIRLLARESLLLFSLAVLTSILSGVSNMAVLVLLFRILRESVRPEVQWWEFGALATAALGFRGLSQLVLGHISRKSMRERRVQLARQIAHVPLIELERIGGPRLIAALTNDIGTVAAALPSFVRLATNLSFLIACLAYLGSLAPERVGVILLVIAAGLAAYHGLHRQALKHVRESRRNWDELLLTFRSLVEGAKELRLNAGRRTQVLETFEAHASNLLRSARYQSAFFGSAAGGIQLLFFVALGISIFGFDPQMNDRGLLISFTVSIIYMMGPLRSLADVARGLGEAEESVAHRPRPAARCRALELVGVTHSYRVDREKESFTLGPIDLTLRAGEIVFVVGANGSGKTTLAKLLTGLYLPQAGEIRLDGEAVTASTRDWYSQHFGAIFSDFFLFDRLVGVSKDGRAAELLSAFRIGDKVEIMDESLSTTTSLSLGERKRLALVLVSLEDRPIYVFDEWSAEQDPAFKDVFYKEILVDLRARGKLIIVISHDDRYFDVADRMLTLERGRSPTLVGRPAPHHGAREIVESV
jgi:putative pyoverdin transport system ATP-binding/permease protein